MRIREETSFVSNYTLSHLLSSFCLFVALSLLASGRLRLLRAAAGGCGSASIASRRRLASPPTGETASSASRQHTSLPGRISHSPH